LEAALATVARQFGPSIVTSPNGDATRPPAVIPTGSLALDHTLGIGGIPKGRITEIYGPEGVGKTTLALSVLAQAQRSGATGLFIDTEHALDFAWAATVGVDPQRLLLCRPESGEQAPQVASVLVDSGAVEVLVVDSIAALVPQAELDAPVGHQHAGVQANLLSHALRKLAGPIARAQVAVVATNQLRQRAGVPGQALYTAGGRALGYYASIRLQLRLAQSVAEQERVVGSRVRVHVTKNKLAPAWQTCELELHADHGLSGEASLLDLGLETGLLIQRGAWVSYGSIQIGRGRSRPDPREVDRRDQDHDRCPSACPGCPAVGAARVLARPPMQPTTPPSATLSARSRGRAGRLGRTSEKGIAVIWTAIWSVLVFVLALSLLLFHGDSILAFAAEQLRERRTHHLQLERERTKQARLGHDRDMLIWRELDDATSSEQAPEPR
jgi:recombination protein RecA